MIQVDMMVDDEGYGVLQVGGVLCAVIPFYQLRPEQIPRVDEGSGRFRPGSGTTGRRKE